MGLVRVRGWHSEHISLDSLNSLDVLESLIKLVSLRRLGSRGFWKIN